MLVELPTGDPLYKIYFNSEALALLQIPRRIIPIVEYANWLGQYLDSRPTTADLFALYYRLERWGA